MTERKVLRKASVVSVSGWENKVLFNDVKVKDERMKVELIFVSKTIQIIHIR